MGVESAFTAITRQRRNHHYWFMNDSGTDDYGEWLRLAEEAFGAMAEDGPVLVDLLRWR